MVAVLHNIYIYIYIYIYILRKGKLERGKGHLVLSNTSGSIITYIFILIPAAKKIKIKGLLVRRLIVKFTFSKKNNSKVYL
jgi:hypothetical protein